MRVGLDVSKILPPRDGIGRYVRGLLRALASADAGRQHDFWLYGTLHPVAPDAIDRLLPALPPNVHLSPEQEPQPGDVDLFHATSWQLPGAYDGPVVLSCYDLTVLTHARHHTVANRAHVLRGLLEARLADAHFVTLSDDTARTLGHWLEVPAERTHVVPPGVGERFGPVPPDVASAVARRLGLERPYIVAVGTREPRKNFGRLLDAWLDLPEALRAAYDLAVIGRVGWQHAALDARLADAEMDGQIHVLGAVDDDDLPALYAGAAALAFPSLAEGFGMPVLEAMACGTPVITSACSSLPEAAGDAGILVDPHDVGALRDAMVTVLDDPPYAATLRAAGQARTADFTWARCADAMIDVYRQAVSG